jgi:23S rRNA (pseudouridine1915-N3)-methyltransferase
VRITIIAVGRLKESFWRDAAAEYLKRLPPYADVRVIEVPDRDPGKGGDARALAEEGEAVLRAIPEGAHVIALEVGSRSLSSERFAERLSGLALDGRSHVAFLIGGSLGLADGVLARADERVSFGDMTLPHNLARIVLLEQVYRAFRIIRGEPYHK